MSFSVSNRALIKMTKEQIDSYYDPDDNHLLDVECPDLRSTFLREVSREFYPDLNELIMVFKDADANDRAVINRTLVALTDYTLPFLIRLSRDYEV
jgi:hypothetical protein